MRKITKKHAVSQNIEVTNCFCCRLRDANTPLACASFNGVHPVDMCVSSRCFACWGYKIWPCLACLWSCICSLNSMCFAGRREKFNRPTG